MKVSRVLSYSAELGGGNIHEFGAGFLAWKHYWYSNNLTEQLTRKFHKTQKRDDIKPMEKHQYDEIAKLIFDESEQRSTFVGMPVKVIEKHLNSDGTYIQEMCEMGLLQRGFFKPKEPVKFLFWTIRNTDEIEIVFPTRRLIGMIYMRKERAGEPRDI